MKKTVLDEREQQTMYRIEHSGFWASTILLSAAIVIQLFLGADALQIAGEAAVLFIVGIGMIAAYFVGGIWDENTRPGHADNIRYSLACALAAGFLGAALRRSAAAGIGVGILALALCFGLLELLMAYMEKRRRKADEELSDEDGE